MEGFADLMRRKLQLSDEIERRRRTQGQLEHDGSKAETDLAHWQTELQAIDHHKQRLESKMNNLQAEIHQIEAKYAENASILCALTGEHEALASIEGQSVQEYIDQTEACPGCGHAADGLTWTWVEFFDAGRVSGWRAVCPDCRDDVAFFEVE